MIETTPQKKVLLVGGSPRKNGNSDHILNNLNESIPHTISSSTINLRDYRFNSCIGCEKCRKSKSCTGQEDEMQQIYPPLIESQGLILVSPTHHYNVTAWMKAFIDRLYCFYDFGNDVPRSWSSRLANQNRKAAIVAICEQEDEKDMGFTIEAMKWPLQAIGYEIVAQLAIFRIFKRGGVKEDPGALSQISDVGIKLVESMQI